MTRDEPGAPDADYLRLDPLDFRAALGAFTTGVAIIAAATPDGRRAGLTANSFASVSLAPPLVLWSLSLHSQSLAIFQEASHFAVNVLGRHQAELATRFARPSEDRFSGVATDAGLGGAPLIADCVAQFQCRNAMRHYGGDHVIFLGAVEAYAHDGRPPLVFSRGRFGDFAPLG
ncbi:MAG: flavin reductase family protein [Methylobacteriaceae bacterium]|nr:flavin reductase family protein [Methylobacteriaceae bacterium]